MHHPLPQIMNLNLPLTSPEATPIAQGFSVSRADGRLTYFSNLLPFDSHDVDDHQAKALAIGRLRAECQLPAKDIVRALGVSRQSVTNHARTYREQGAAGFFKTRKARRRTAVDEATKARAEQLLADGMSGREVARQLNVARATLSENIRAGVIDLPAKDVRTVSTDDAGTHRSERDALERSAPMGRAATDVAGRTLAMAGVPDAGVVSFDKAAYSVERGGALAAVPMLLEEGLLSAPVQLPNGYYGLPSILLFVALMCVARVPNPERLRYQAPGEWGQLLGLDRCPEVKTLRSKLAALSEDFNAVLGWQQTLASRWLAADGDAAATLAVDGHVKVYSGSKGRIAKKFVPRQKLCLSASVSYWINTLGGQPLLCLHQDYDPGLVKVLEGEVLKELDSIGALPSQVPDLTVAGTVATPAVTLVFDREGWSPAMFKRLARRGIACITWQKNFNAERWAEADYQAHTVTIHGPAHSHEQQVLLAEQPLKLSNKLAVRQIRRRLACGREAAIITTHPTLAINEVAGVLFSRWAQENYFKYMRDEFNLDALTTYVLDPLDADTLVVNPTWRVLDKQVKRYRARLGSLRNRLAKCPAGDRATVAQKNRHCELTQDTEALQLELEQALAACKSTDKHIRAGELDEKDRLDVLPRSQRLLVDLIRMIAYRAETRMLPAVSGAQGKKRNPRKALQMLFGADANLIPDHDKGTLTVQVHGLGSNCVDGTLMPLLDELTATETCYPGTKLKLVYEISGNGSQA